MTESNGYSCHIQAHIASLRLLQTMFTRSFAGEMETAHLIFQALPCRSNILWLTGHLAWVQDKGINPVLGSPTVLPEHYGKLFGKGSEPLADSAAYPPLDELTCAFEQAIARTIAALGKLTDEDLSKPFPETLPLAKFLKTIDDIIPWGIYHAGYHLGQIGLLRRAQGLPTGLGV